MSSIGCLEPPSCGSARRSKRSSGLSAAAVEFDGAVAKFDLQLTVLPKAEPGFSALFSYAIELFDEATIAEFARRFERLLTAIVAAPERAVGDLDLLH